MPDEDEARKWQNFKKELNKALDELLQDNTTRKPANWNSVVEAFRLELNGMFKYVEKINNYRQTSNESNNEKIKNEITNMLSELNILKDNLFLSIMKYAPPAYSNYLTAVINKIESVTTIPDQKIQKLQNTQSNDAAFSRGFLGWVKEFEKLLDISESAAKSTQNITSISNTNKSSSKDDLELRAFKENSYVQQEIIKLLGGLENQKAALEKNKGVLSNVLYEDKSRAISNYATQLEIKYKECMTRKDTLCKNNPDLNIIAQRRPTK